MKNTKKIDTGRTCYECGKPIADICDNYFCDGICEENYKSKNYKNNPLTKKLLSLDEIKMRLLEIGKEVGDKSKTQVEQAEEIFGY